MNISHTGRLAIRPNWYPVNSLEPKTLYVIFLASYILIFSFSYGGWKLIMKNFWPIDFSPQHRKDHIVTIQFYTRWRREHSSVQFSRSVMSRLFATPWIAARRASLSITNSREFTQTHVHWVGDAIQPSHPLSSPSPPAPNPSETVNKFRV